MDILYDKEKLCKVFYDFYKATGIECQILLRGDKQSDYQGYWKNCGYCGMLQKSKSASSQCYNSNRKLIQRCKRTGKVESGICYAGLIDTCIPVFCEGEIIAFILFGRMRRGDDFSKVAPLIKKYKLDHKKMEKLYKKLDIYDEEKVKSIAGVAAMLASYAMSEKIVRKGYNSQIEKAKKYIWENVEKRINVKDISENINMSKSVIYREFKKCFGMTVMNI